MEILKWQKLSSRYLVKEQWATLRVDTCDLQNGIVKDDYFVLEYPNWVNAVALTADNEIIMVRQYRHAGDIISLEIPGGVIDGDEKPEDAVRRELLEETGYSFQTIALIATLYPNPATANNVTYTYLLTGGVKTQEQHLDEHEILNVEKYSIAEVKQLLLENKIDQSLHASALFYGLLKLEAIQ
ncbi:ADP-ribose pyrophosphatase YjhB, NUDIX family [Pedobacter steynii]|uniref:GDP-mannose pyrophosphatase n=1 Tax=Pedobacter steynii TaxID=430522 RepID=A0A1G9XGX3_9SPHI|nr:NUDIX hydrolase [Pedobacter steynii]NQX40590.1 NUDIX hydrolase [Pedobacter steynii]SDM95957.1 ADP-ribose pyrophosphatase YjhB, NUDIX family [Pedobacter steynii]